MLYNKSEHKSNLMRSHTMDKKLNQITQEIINEKVENLNSHISRKLRESRQKALAPKKHFFDLSRFWLMPVTAMAALAAYIILPLLLSNSVPLQINDQQALSIVQEMDMIDQMELVEDLEFYEWLSSEDDFSTI